MKVRMLFETGYEEVEALTVVDLLRRAKVDCLMVAADDQDTVTGSHGITVKMDEKISELADDADMIVLPGGMPGVTNLIANEKVKNLVCGQYEAGRYVAAICAAPATISPCSGNRACSIPIEPTSKKFLIWFSAENSLTHLQCSALLISLFGVK